MSPSKTCPSRKMKQGFSNGEAHRADKTPSSDSVSVSNDRNRKIISFDELSEGKQVVIIDFRGQHYRLRLTKAGRLVLNK